MFGESAERKIAQSGIWRVALISATSFLTACNFSQSNFTSNRSLPSQAQSSGGNQTSLPSPTSTPTTTFSATPSPIPATMAGSKIGVNVGGLSDWGNNNMFVDALKSARGWSPVGGTCVLDYGGNCPTTGYPATDTLGWPLSDFSVVLITDGGDPLNRPTSVRKPSLAGNYTVVFNGQATVSVYDGSGTVGTPSYNSATNTTTVVVNLPADVPQLFLSFTNTIYSTNVQGVKNLKILRPGYGANTTQTFTTEFLNAIAPYSTLRFMDPLCTNGSSETNFSQRTLVTAPLQGGCFAHNPGGIAYEYIIQLANLTGKDIWINIPHLADVTAFSTSLAQLLKAQLNPGIHVYLEWSNEVWNNEFQQTADNHNAAIASVAAGDPDHLNFDNGNNSWYQGYRRVALQASKMSDAFRAVYGDAAMMTTIRPVFAFQYTYEYLTVDAMYYIQKNLGAPSHYFYGIAGAPYWQAAAGNYSTVDDLMTAVATNLNGTILPNANHGTATTQSIGNDGAFGGATFNEIASYYGIKSLSYEGSSDISLNTNQVVSEQSKSDPRNATYLNSFMQQWFGCGNDLFMDYTLTGSPGGGWELYEDLTLPTVKSQTLANLAATPLTSFTGCQ